MAYSAVFGQVEALMNNEMEVLRDYIKRAPHIVYSELDKSMKKRNLSVVITSLKQEQKKKEV